MRPIARTIFLLIVMFGQLSESSATDREEGRIIKDTTSEFNKSESEAQRQLATTGFFNALQPFSLGARAPSVTEIKATVVMPNLGRGDPKSEYDVILQPGHYQRISGRVGTSGAQVTEQQLVAFIVANVATYLIGKGVTVLVIPADNFDKSGLNTEVFLAIHADGSEKQCTTGPSLGYKHDSSLLGMHALAFALAASMGQTYDDFKKDNFTVDERDYYTFSYIKAQGYSGLLEVGELTCPKVEKALISNALLIAQNLGVALKSAVDILKEPRPDTQSSKTR